MVEAKVGEKWERRSISRFLSREKDTKVSKRGGGEKKKRGERWRERGEHGAKTEVARLETVVFRSWRELRATRT